jgi:hypothetical protein
MWKWNWNTQGTDVHCSVAGRALARSFMLWLRSRYIRHLNIKHYLLLSPLVPFYYNNNNNNNNNNIS